MDLINAQIINFSVLYNQYNTWNITMFAALHWLYVDYRIQFDQKTQ